MLLGETRSGSSPRRPLAALAWAAAAAEGASPVQSSYAPARVLVTKTKGTFARRRRRDRSHNTVAASKESSLTTSPSPTPSIPPGLIYFSFPRRCWGSEPALLTEERESLPLATPFAALGPSRLKCGSKTTLHQASQPQQPPAPRPSCHIPLSTTRNTPRRCANGKSVARDPD